MQRGPCASLYVKDLVGDLPEEGGHLGGHDKPSPAGVRVIVDRNRVVVWSSELLCLSDDVWAHLCWAHPVRVQSMVIRETLSIVIVFCF